MARKKRNRSNEPTKIRKCHEKYFFQHVCANRLGSILWITTFIVGINVFSEAQVVDNLTPDVQLMLQRSGGGAEDNNYRSANQNMTSEMSDMIAFRNPISNRKPIVLPAIVPFIKHESPHISSRMHDLHQLRISIRYVAEAPTGIRRYFAEEKTVALDAETLAVGSFQVTPNCAGSNAGTGGASIIAGCILGNNFFLASTWICSVGYCDGIVFFSWSVMRRSFLLFC
jgi:hypothetical protein